MKKILFIDRDGTLIVEPTDNFQIDSLAKLEFIPGLITWLGRIVSQLDYTLVMVTNQDGLGTDSFPENDFWPAHEKMLTTLRNEGIIFEDIHIDRSFDHEKKDTRKPGLGMMGKYFSPEYNLAESYVIGDRVTDARFAANLGCKMILFNSSVPALGLDIDLRAGSWKEVYNFLRLPHRVFDLIRHTKETNVDIRIDLDGTGDTDISTGLGFFDHMLEQIGRHAECNLKIKVTGDLHIDEHHTIEDTGIALGETILKALGDKKGIERYAFHLPMDEADAEVLIDFGGRPWLIWQAEFRREKIGEMPTEMFQHFFKSFSDAAKCNLHIRCRGDNEHHKIEAIFKAFAKCIRMAKQRNPESDLLPSTKGML
ncbi:MAG: bifunctional histidinol-phosphatase/imidazoleglycerol-phosphate dehydratase HisB [Saprospiraceae bacterium]